VSLLVMLPIVVALELVTRFSATLRPCRTSLRLLLGLFWLAVLFAYYGSRFGWVPARFHYSAEPAFQRVGDGIFRFAADSNTYRLEALGIAEALRTGSLDALVQRDTFLYSKIVGVLYAIFGPDPLAAMLFNGVFYLTTLIAVFVLGRTLFGERTGLLAMWIAGLWPTFFLHQTQTIRWAATSAAICAMVTASVIILGNGRILRVLAAAAVCYPILLYDVPYMARLTYVGLFGFAAILLVAGLRWRRYPTRGLRTLTLGLVLFVAYQAVWAPPPGAPANPVHTMGTIPSGSYVERLVAHVVLERKSFQREELQNAATNFPTWAELNTFGDLVRNAPAAFAAAFFAPYPWMLLGGPAGVSGPRQYLLAEMALYYLLLPLIVAGVVVTIRRPRFFVRVQGMFLALFMLGIYGLLGTVVLNAGTLHRLRLPYILVQLVFAAGAVRAIVRRGAEDSAPREAREEMWHPIAEVAIPERR
jgi:hypothetical protein